MSSGMLPVASWGPGAEGLPELIHSWENRAQTGQRLVGPPPSPAHQQKIAGVRILAARIVSLLLACEVLVIPVKTWVARSWCGAQFLS